MEATLGFEPRNESFAGSCLTTWPCRRFIFIRTIMVRMVRIELTLRNRNRILSPARLPIPPHSHFPKINGAGDGIRTRGPNLGKVVLYP